MSYLVDSCRDYLKMAWDMKRFIAKQGGEPIKEIECEGPNPYYNQMEQGVVLESSYGSPEKLYTPCGYFRIGGNFNGYKEVSEKANEAIKGPLGLELLSEKTYIPGAEEFGPRHKVTEWEGQKIPEPKFRDASNYIHYEEIKKVWKDFCHKDPDCSRYCPVNCNDFRV